MVLDWFNDKRKVTETENETAKAEFEAACAETHEDKKSRANRIIISIVEIMEAFMNLAKNS